MLHHHMFPNVSKKEVHNWYLRWMSWEHAFLDYWLLKALLQHSVQHSCTFNEPDFLGLPHGHSDECVHCLGCKCGTFWYINWWRTIVGQTKGFLFSSYIHISTKTWSQLYYLKLISCPSSLILLCMTQHEIKSAPPANHMRKMKVTWTLDDLNFISILFMENSSLCTRILLMDMLHISEKTEFELNQTSTYYRCSQEGISGQPDSIR